MTTIPSLPLPRAAAGLALALALGEPAHAGEGVIEINAARALAGGITTGDAPGFPVTLSQPGAYRLTSDLVVGRGGGGGTANTTILLVTADFVDIDLNGFGLRGPASCSGVPASCAGTGTGRGVDASGNAGAAIHDGTVEGLGSNGIFAGSDAQVWNLVARGNGGNGVFVGNGGVARNVVASGNGGGGIVGGANVLVHDSTASANANAGIFVQAGSRIRDVTSTSNGADGIAASSNSVITGCTSRSNEGDGIQVAARAVIRECTVSTNDGAGIRATGNENVLQASVVGGNDQASLDGGIRYEATFVGCSAQPVEPVINGAALSTNGSSPTGLLACIVGP